MRLAILATFTLMAALTPLQAAAAGRSSQSLSAQDAYRYLANPTSGDEFGFRNAFHGYAQQRSDGLFSALASVLGGSSPQLNFVQPGSDFTPNHMSANLRDRPGAPVGQINLDPLATSSLIVDNAGDHNLVVNGMPHEMMHVKQQPSVLASLADREGGAQAFADLVTAAAAQKAAIPYQPGNYDGAYTDFVKAAQARGRDWLLAGQMGRSTPAPAWP